MAAHPTIDLPLIAGELERVGYIILQAPLLKRQSKRLLIRCNDDHHGRFHAARTGRGVAKTQPGSIRGDMISWLDNANAIDRDYLAWMEALRMGLNAALYLGLFHYEGHYAIYGAGAGYARHSDVLAGSPGRILSTVFYLNVGWEAGDGGELRLFAPVGNAVIATVAPSFGTMIIFLSESFPHQVLAAHHERRSIAGWFRGRAQG